MKRIGAHVSTLGGVSNAPARAKEIGAKAFALFTKNQKQWKTKPLESKEIDRFKQEISLHKFSPEHILPHDGYLINLGNPEKEKREKSFESFLDELTRCEMLGLCYLNIHPGAHLKKISESECIRYIAENINKGLDKTTGVTVLLENTAGQGSSVGYKFEHLAEIIDKVEDKNRIGVCYDTCHGFAAGYDMRTKETYEKTMQEFDNIIGLEKLKGMHLNDAKSEYKSRVDRHHSIGQGNIGINAFKFIMNDKRIDEIPMILETINSDIWKEEIKLLYGLIKA